MGSMSEADMFKRVKGYRWVTTRSISSRHHSGVHLELSTAFSEVRVFHVVGLWGFDLFISFTYILN